MGTAVTEFAPGVYEDRRVGPDPRVGSGGNFDERRQADRRRYATVFDPSMWPTPQPDSDVQESLSDTDASLTVLYVEHTDTHPRFEGKLQVRPARPTENDLVGLVNLEFAAYADVYGTRIRQTVHDQVTQKFDERINVLGDWVTVIEDSVSHDIAGMLVACPTDKEPDELLEHDMTSAAALSEVYSKDGKNLYVINLATHPKAPKNLRFMLFGDLAAKGMIANSRKVWFESRLPGLGKWMEDNGHDSTKLSDAEKDLLAEVYSRETINYKGRELPVDKLLRLYAQIGAKPLRLVPDAWVADKPSSSYGVLCEYDNPLPESIAKLNIVRSLAAKAIGLTTNHKRVMQMVLGGR